MSSRFSSYAKLPELSLICIKRHIVIAGKNSLTHLSQRVTGRQRSKVTARRSTPEQQNKTCCIVGRKASRDVSNRRPTMEATIGSVFLAAFITALVTGLGAVPFLFVRNISPWWLSIANGAAAGLMLGASHNLITEGTKLDPGRMLLGILAGLIAIVAANWLIRRRRTVEIAELHGASARKALLLLGVMTAHSFAEGVGVGVSLGGAGELGVFITTAIAIHNIPEGLAICWC